MTASFCLLTTLPALGSSEASYGPGRFTVMEIPGRGQLTFDLPIGWKSSSGMLPYASNYTTAILKNISGTEINILEKKDTASETQMLATVTGRWLKDIPGKTPVAGITGPEFNCYYYSIPLNKDGLWRASGFATIESLLLSVTIFFMETNELDHALSILKSGRVESRSFIIKNNPLIDETPLPHMDPIYYKSSRKPLDPIGIMLPLDSEGGVLIPNKYINPQPVNSSEDVIITVE